MKKIIDLLAGAGSHKDEKLLDYVMSSYVGIIEEVLKIILENFLI